MSVSPALAAGGGCEGLDRHVQAAITAGDARALRGLVDRTAATPDCTADYRAWVGHTTARVLAREVQEGLRAGRSLTDYLDRVVDVASFGQYWLLHAWLGDLYADRQDFARAARDYQLALTAIEDERVTPTPPPTAVIERLFRMAEQNRLLAAEYVPSPVTRAGTQGGLGASSIRGFVPEAVALPIEFEFGSTAFTTKGDQAVAELARLLGGQGCLTVTLVGHTDPVGGDEYNLGLSRRRAEAVRDFLKRGGYCGQVMTEGRGERVPLRVTEAGRYSREQLHQMMRRVELRR